MASQAPLPPSFYDCCTYAAGIAGNLCAFVLFVSPIPTFKRIVRNRSTEQFSGLPYIYSLLNCLICLWYGVFQGVLMVVTVNSSGAVFQLVYITIFIVFADNRKRMKMSALLAGVFCVFALIIYATLKLMEGRMQRHFIGYLSVASLISMFASPLFIIVCSVFNKFQNFSFMFRFMILVIVCIGPFSYSNTLLILLTCQNLVIRTKSVEFMPFYLSLATFLMSISFFGYGMLLNDFFIYIPNGIGTVLAIIQLLLYANYSKKSREESTLPLLR